MGRHAAYARHPRDTLHSARTCVYLRGDGTLTTIQVSAAPLLTASGKTLGAVMTLTDLESTPERSDDGNLAENLTASLLGSGGTPQALDSFRSPKECPPVPASSIE